MGTISDKLTYLNTTKTKIREGLNTLGADLDTEDTFRSYADAIEGIYEDYPKITGEGTDLSLDNTKQASMKIDYKGNTSQVQYTGKNLLKNYVHENDDTFTVSGITFIKNSDGSITANGTATGTANYYYIGEQSSERKSISANTYILSGCPSGGNNSKYKITFGITGVGEKYDYDSGNTFTISSDTTCYCKLQIFTGTSVSNLTFKPMIRLSSITDSTYEPYVGGTASPNPSYPSPVNVVSGDNTIDICGKNLLSEDNLLVGIYTPSANPTISGSGDVYKSFNLKLPQGTYSLFSNKSLNVVRDFSSYDYSGNATLGSFPANQKATFTLTQSATIYFTFRKYDNTAWNSEQDKVWLTKGSGNETYEPYIGNSYPLYLGVENLFDLSKFTNLNTNTSISINDNTLTITNTTSGYGIKSEVLTLKPNTTYTASVKSTWNITKPTSGWGWRLHNVTKNTYGSNANNDIYSFTTTSDNDTYEILYYIGSPNNNAGTVVLNEIQLEVGSKVNSYTPYGVSPIELCKIGNYQDKIFKGKGTNLFDEEYELGNINYDTGALESSTTIIRTKNYQTIKPSTQYTLKVPNEVTGIILYYYNNGSYIGGVQPTIGSTTHTIIFTTNASANQVKWRFNSNYTTLNNQTMLNEGNASLPYEPYNAKGKWYLHKEIGKVVLDGTETINVAGSGYTAQGRFQFENIVCKKGESSSPNAMSNYFKSNFAVTNGSIFISGVNGYINAMDTSYTNDLAGFKTWLGTNKPIVYYVLANSTNTEITDTNLIEQLEEAKLSYVSQTNISQENNDLPFILDVKALRGE